MRDNRFPDFLAEIVERGGRCGHTWIHVNGPKPKACPVCERFRALKEGRGGSRKIVSEFYESEAERQFQSPMISANRVKGTTESEEA